MKSFLVFVFALLPFFSFSQTKEDPLQHARVLKDSGKFEEALKEANRFIRADPTNADYFGFRGDVYVGLKLFDEAIADYTKAISLNPKDPYPYHHRAALYYSIQEPDRAIEDNEMAILYSPNDSIKYDFILNRGAYYEMKRDFQKAYEDYVTVLKFDSVNQAALTNIATVLDELGKADKAIEYLEKVIRLYPDFVGGYGNLAFQYQQQGDYKKALEYNNKVLELDSNQPLAYNNRGFVKYKLGELKGALEDVNYSLKLYPSNSFAYKNRALIFIELKQYNFACEDLKKAITLGFTEMYGDEVQKLLEKYCARSN